MSGDQGTVGTLIGPAGRVCYTLELPDRNNKAGLSRIPAGIYNVRYLKRSASGRFRDVYHIEGVKGRSGILAHGGNLAGDVLKGWLTHSHGCTLPARKLGILGGQFAGLMSKAAMRDIHKATGRKDFILEVR